LGITQDHLKRRQYLESKRSIIQNFYLMQESMCFLKVWCDVSRRPCLQQLSAETPARRSAMNKRVTLVWRVMWLAASAAETRSKSVAEATAPTMKLDTYALAQKVRIIYQIDEVFSHLVKPVDLNSNWAYCYSRGTVGCSIIFFSTWLESKKKKRKKLSRCHENWKRWISMYKIYKDNY
jgi:hypothetical protein